MRRELSGIHAVWLREFTVFQREKSRVISAIVQPLMWIFLFGGGMGGSGGERAAIAGLPHGIGYQQFIFPGMVMMSTVFSSTFYGLYIVWDRKIDVLKAILVAPVSRTSIFFGKVLGGCTDVLLQSSVLLVVGYFVLGRPGPGYWLLVPPALVIVFLTAVGMVSIGLALGSLFESFEGFQVVTTFLSFPLFFLSGALYPLTEGLRQSQPWIYLAAQLDPISYPVDALRGLLLDASSNAPALNFGVMLGFAVATVAVGGFAFRRMKL
jgi:ABC-2 type transport system permease protein